MKATETNKVMSYGVKEQKEQKKKQKDKDAVIKTA